MDRTNRSGRPGTGRQEKEIARLERQLDAAFGEIRSREDAGLISTYEAAQQRIAELERHLRESRALREFHLGTQGGDQP